MKKVKVLRKFKDKRTNAIRHKDEIIEISEERFNEIMKTGPYIEEVTQPKENSSTDTSSETKADESAAETKTTKKISKKTAAE